MGTGRLGLLKNDYWTMSSVFIGLATSVCRVSPLFRPISCKAMACSGKVFD
jgi:hypothetical protein